MYAKGRPGVSVGEDHSAWWREMGSGSAGAHPRSPESSPLYRQQRTLQRAHGHRPSHNQLTAASPKGELRHCHGNTVDLEHAQGVHAAKLICRPWVGFRRAVDEECEKTYRDGGIEMGSIMHDINDRNDYQLRTKMPTCCVPCTGHNSVAVPTCIGAGFLT